MFTNDGTGCRTRSCIEARTASGSGRLPVAPGKRTTLNVDLTDPGVYTLYCPIDGHRAKGEHALITMGDD